MGCDGAVDLKMSAGGRCAVVNALVSPALHNELMISWHDMLLLGILPPSFPAAAFSTHTAESGRGSATQPHLSVPSRQAETAVPRQQQHLPQPTAAEAAAIWALVEEYADVFDSSAVRPMKGAPMKIHLKPGAKPYRVTTARQVPKHFEAAAAAATKLFVDSGVIERCHHDSATPWTAAGFYVAKATPGAVRLVVDMKNLNDWIERPVHPFKSAQDILQGIPATARVFAKTDMLNGYYQVPLDEASKDLTAFLLPDGRYRFCRAPQGLSQSGDDFCDRTDAAYEGLEHFQKIVDDGLADAASYQELLTVLRAVFQRSRENGITLSRKKFKFGPSIDFAGFVISSDGARPDPARLSALAAFPAPRDVGELRAWLGLANTLSNSTPDMAHLSLVLRGLLQKGVAFQWTADHHDAFLAMKRALLTPAVVKYFDSALPTELHTDASLVGGLGYALLQRGPDGAPRLISCGSRSLLPAESRYSVIELEMLAAAWATKSARFYLAGCPHWTLVVDHRPLVGIFSKPLLEIPNNRLLRFRERMQDFTFSVEWVPGKSHLIADALSRAPHFSPAEDDAAVVAAVATCCNIVASDPLLQPLFAAAADDAPYQALLAALVGNKLVADLPPGHAAKQYASMWDRLSVHENALVVLDSNRIVVPATFRVSLLAALHEGHGGILRAKKLATMHWYWPGMTAAVQNMVEACDKCQTHRASLQLEPPYMRPASRGPWDDVAMDLFTVGGREYLLLVDRFSGFPFVHLLNNLSAAAIARHVDGLCLQFGYFRRCLSDGGPQFKGDFSSWCVANGIEQGYSSPRHPASNGLAEGSVSTVKKLLLKCSTFSEMTRQLLYWRNTPRTIGKETPAELFFGRRQRCPRWPALPATPPVFAPPPSPPASHLQPLPIGMRVRVQDTESKLWDGTGVVVAIADAGRSYYVQLLGGPAAGAIRHRNRIFVRPASVAALAGYRPAAPAAPATSAPAASAPASASADSPPPRRGTRIRTSPVRYAA